MRRRLLVHGVLLRRQPLIARSTFLLWIPAAVAGAVDDWTQFRGAARDGISRETGLLERWPDGGPPEVWRRPIGQGFSAITVSDGMLYTLAADGITTDGIAEGETREYAIALRASDGAEVWRTVLDRAYADDRGSGPRSSPTVWRDRVFVLSGYGKLFALARADGAVLWRRDLVADHGGRLPIWGYSASVLVDGELLFVAGGGDQGSILAFRPESGALAWSAGSSHPSYASPVAVDLAGLRQIVFLQGDRLVGMSSEGEELWTYPWPVINNINVATPLVLPADQIFVSTSYDVGAAVVRVSRSGDHFEVAEVWRSRVMKNHFHASVYWRGHIYGFDNAFLSCIDAATGKELWRTRGLGKGSVLVADGKLVVLSERGRLVLAELDHEAFREISAHQVFEARAWTAPSLSNGQLYLRSESELVRLDLRAQGGGR
ncbi:MAG TPA: PQQ-binding-like beta-propeller repeat protein [Thermoanaerobaculia bacterium]|nr:PQQ-binding-like beta-propeller repeat protein [Thermoanaerobaculia bacterium]